MSKPPTSATTRSTGDPGPDPDDITAVLLEVLRKVSREVDEETPPLPPAALAAVAQFQAISLSLRTLADRNTFGNSTGTAGFGSRATVR